MKIKLAILEKDKSYLSRIVSVLSTKYSDKFEIYSFTDSEVALSTLNESMIDVLVSSEAFDIDVTRLPKRCGFAYFVDLPDVEMVNNHRAICKFQKADLIYKQILSIYSENVGNISGLKLGDDSAKIVVFSAVSGGVGSSTMAAAYAVHLSSQGKKVLYLNLEDFGSSDVFFSAEGQFDMSDIIFALKSKKTNLALKLESCVKQDKRGVYFYSEPKIALDMIELGYDEIIRLISELKLTGTYDYIVLDSDFSLEKGALKVYREAHAIVWICDGSEISDTKTIRAYQAIATLDQNSDSPLTNRMLLIYNKFSNKTGKAIGDIGLKSIGGAPRFEHATTDMIISQLSPMEMFEKII